MRFAPHLSKSIAKKRIFFDTPELRTLPQKTETDERHLSAAMHWLCTAQDATGVDGVSASYDLRHRTWGKPYRETTGYIIDTFLDYYHLAKEASFLERAIKMGTWELGQQCSDGSYGEPDASGTIKKKVFNTGQVILGLTSLYKETKKLDYLSASTKAADWLVQHQENDGSWNTYTTRGPKTYHSRVAWALLKVYQLTDNPIYFEAAKKNLSWVVQRQTANGWFEQTSLTSIDAPWTHLIAYTISGILESTSFDPSLQGLFEVAYFSADRVLSLYEHQPESSSALLPCSFNRSWQPINNFSCLTGDAQLAIIWIQLFNITQERKFLDGANRMIEQLKAVQLLKAKRAEIVGGVFGSFPIDGEYASFQMINWAAKFFADALLQKISVQHL